ncbi:hypothetical protein ACFVVX_15705 [Kitasatospora sp. NPDC058170]|uniref:hypothetical protein n=1 Tax=Kitasatospora sp. NPDC058170 TaxID=3346364 RepID=UPI0036DB2656
MSRARRLTAVLAGAACLLLALAAGAATTAAVRYEHAVHGPVVLAGTTYTAGLLLLISAGLLGAGRAAEDVR